MPGLRPHLLPIAALILMSGCSYGDSLATKTATATNDDKASPGAATTPAPPPLGTGVYALPPVAPSADTGTAVGPQATSLRSDLQQLRDSINQHDQELQKLRASLAQDAATYYDLASALSRALSALDRMSDDVARLDALASATANDSAQAARLQDSTKAAAGQVGAADADKRQLTQLGEESNRMRETLNRLSDALKDDIRQQSDYVGNERAAIIAREMVALAAKNGDLPAQHPSSATAGAATPAKAPPVSTGNRRPLVVIRFDRPNIAYEQALYTAVSRALDKRPDARFDLVAVAPNASSAAQVTAGTNASKRNAESVLRSLAKMGLPVDRVSLSAATSPDARVNEIHLYVR